MLARAVLGCPAGDHAVGCLVNRAVGVAARCRAGQAATPVPPGARCPGAGIVAAVVWKACRAVVRRCRCRLRQPGGRAAGLPVVWQRAAALVGPGAGAAGPAAGRRGGAAAASPGALPLLRAHPRPAARLVRAPARRLRRGDRHRAGISAGRGGLPADRRGPGRAAGDRTGLAAPPALARGGHAPLRDGRAGRARRHRSGAAAPAASPLGDALNAVAAAAHAAIAGNGCGLLGLWPLLGRFGLARHLAPARPG